MIRNVAESSEFLTPIRSVGVTTRSLSSELRRRSAAASVTPDSSSQQVPEPVLADELERQWKEDPHLFLTVSVCPADQMQSDAVPLMSVSVCQSSHVIQQPHHMLLSAACDCLICFLLLSFSMPLHANAAPPLLSLPPVEQSLHLFSCFSLPPKIIM